MTTVLARAARRLVDPNHQGAKASPIAMRTGWPGLYLGVGQQGPVLAGAEHHALVLGPPRSGKTTRLATPNLRLHPGPAVVTSTKTDIAAATHPWRTRLGRCWLWDPTGSLPRPDGVTDLRWSPVVGCEHWDTAVATAHVLAGAARPAGPAHLGQSDAHWIERSQALLAPLLHAAGVVEGDLAVVMAWLNRRELIQPLSLLHDRGSPIAVNLLEGVAHTDAREQSGIFSTADGLLAAYRTEAALTTTRYPNFDPVRFAASTDTIYLIAPADTHALHAPLVVALLHQIRSATYRHHPDPPVLWALDELAGIAPLPDLPHTLADAASQGLVVLACLQDLSQARARWGQAADGFLTLFTHKLVLPGVADTATLNQISNLAGHHHLLYQSETVPIGLPFANRGGPTRSYTHHRLPRLPVDQIAAGRPGAALWLNRTTHRYVGLPPWH